MNDLLDGAATSGRLHGYEKLATATGITTPRRAVVSRRLVPWDDQLRHKNAVASTTTTSKDRSSVDAANATASSGG